MADLCHISAYNRTISILISSSSRYIYTNRSVQQTYRFIKLITINYHLYHMPDICKHRNFHYHTTTWRNWFLWIYNMLVKPIVCEVHPLYAHRQTVDLRVTGVCIDRSVSRFFANNALTRPGCIALSSRLSCRVFINDLCTAFRSDRTFVFTSNYVLEDEPAYSQVLSSIA